MVGLKLGKAWTEDGVGAAELEAVEALLTKAGLLRGSGGAADAAAVQLALVTGSFGAALHRHWAGWKRYVPRERQWWRWRASEESERRREFEARMSVVVNALQVLGDGHGRGQLGYVDGLTGEPMATPFYRALWDVFTMDSNLRLSGGESAQPFIRKDTPSEIHAFQDRFLLAYWQGLATGPGRRVAAFLDDLKDVYRPRLVRRMMLEHMAGWGTHHVFGNVPRGDEEDYYGLPFMPLDGSYVEPAGEAAFDGERGPILELLRRCLGEATPRIVVVTAPFGMGKSLTARILVRDLAARYLRNPAGDESYPVLVKCARDFEQEVPLLSKMVRKANLRMARGLGIHDYKLSDSVFDPPNDNERVVFILDGLDEVVLSAHKLEQLFKHLDELQTRRQRIVVFTRPVALTSQPSPELCQLIKLRPFDSDRIADWLQRWNALVRPAEDSELAAVTVSPEMIAGRGLMELAKTPILLLMIATTWREDDPARPTPGARALLYERFFQQIAVGKCKYDIEMHKMVSKASKALRDKPVEWGLLDMAADTPDAMLWLMGRLAWERNCLARTKGVEDLDMDDVTALIKGKLDIPTHDLMQSICMALLTVMQADLSARADRFLFGHKSFQEFLEARFWSEQLKRILRARPCEHKDLASELFRGRLMTGDRAAFSLLVEIIQLSKERDTLGWAETDRDRLMRWCEDQFDDARIDSDSGSVHDDIRLPLREVLLGLRCTLGGEFKVDVEQLRSLISGFWVTGERAWLEMPKADLYEAKLKGAQLKGANLESANLESADLEGSDLEGAKLKGAKLKGVNLARANLARAKLQDAYLEGANLQDAYLVRANLKDAFLEGANFKDAKLVRANLRGATHKGASFKGANLHGTILKPSSQKP